MSIAVGSRFSDEMLLSEARDLLRALVETGAQCPCCRQFSKVYKRSIHATMAKSAIKLYRVTARGEYAHLPEVEGGRRGGEAAKLRYWGLAVEEAERREDGGRSGWWCLTDDGRAFVEATHRVPCYAVVYDGRCLRCEGKLVSITDCLGARFDYDELMTR